MIPNYEPSFSLNQGREFFQWAQEQVHDASTRLTPNVVMMLTAFFNFVAKLPFLM